MSYLNVLFVVQLESLDTRRNNLSRSFFQDICKPTSCHHYLIPLPRDTSVTTRLRLTTSLPRPNLCTKKYCSFINFGLHHYQPTQWLLTHFTHLSQHLCTYMHIVCFVCCFIYYFNCISFAVRLSGRKVVIKLIDWWLKRRGKGWHRKWIGTINYGKTCMKMVLPLTVTNRLKYFRQKDIFCNVYCLTWFMHTFQRRF